MAGARLGRRPRRRRPVGPLRPVAPARCVCRDAGASEADGASLPVHLHAGRHRAGLGGAPRGGRRSRLPRDLLGPVRGRCPRPGRPPVCMAVPGPSRADLLERPLPRPRRARPETARRRLHRRPIGASPLLPAGRRARRRGHGRHAGDPGRRPGAEHPETAPALPEPRLDPSRVRPRPAGRRPRRASPGQARRFDQAGDPPRRRGRPAAAGRMAGAVVRLGRSDRGVVPARLDRGVRPRIPAEGALGRDARGPGRAGRAEPGPSRRAAFRAH